MLDLIKPFQQLDHCEKTRWANTMSQKRHEKFQDSNALIKLSRELQAKHAAAKALPQAEPTQRTSADGKLRRLGRLPFSAFTKL